VSLLADFCLGIFLVEATELKEGNRFICGSCDGLLGLLLERLFDCFEVRDPVVGENAYFLSLIFLTEPDRVDFAVPFLATN